MVALFNLYIPYNQVSDFDFLVSLLALTDVYVTGNPLDCADPALAALVDRGGRDHRVSMSSLCRVRRSLHRQQAV